jgi:ESCRT-II complex subunit VPS25
MSREPFPFPREYSFPPFFTRQTNLTTHHAQLVKWSSLILAYCRHHRLFKLSLSSSSSTPSAIPNPSNPTSSDAAADSQPTPGPDELFYNRRLNKRLSIADIKETIDFMRKDGRAEYVGGAGAGDVVWIYWRTPEEWATLIEEWVDGTGQKGTVLTLYELTEGDATSGAGENYPGIEHARLSWDWGLTNLQNRIPRPGYRTIAESPGNTCQERQGADLRPGGFTGCQVLLSLRGYIQLRMSGMLATYYMARPTQGHPNRSVPSVLNG